MDDLTIEEICDKGTVVEHDEDHYVFSFTFDNGTSQLYGVPIECVPEYILNRNYPTVPEDNDPLQPAQAAGNEINEDLWMNKRSKEARAKDHEARLKLIAILSQRRSEMQDKKTSRLVFWSRVADQLRQEGVNLPNPDAWKKVYTQWRKMKSTYSGFVDKSKNQTGNGHVAPPLYYEELHAFLGETHSITPVALSDSLHREVRVPDASKDPDTFNTLEDEDTADTPSVSRPRKPNRGNEQSASALKCMEDLKNIEERKYNFLKEREEKRNTRIEEEARYRREMDAQKLKVAADLVDAIKNLHKKGRKRQRSTDSE